MKPRWLISRVKRPPTPCQSGSARTPVCAHRAGCPLVLSGRRCSRHHAARHRRAGARAGGRIHAVRKDRRRPDRRGQRRAVRRRARGGGGTHRRPGGRRRGRAARAGLGAGARDRDTVRGVLRALRGAGPGGAVDSPPWRRARHRQLDGRAGAAVLPCSAGGPRAALGGDVRRHRPPARAERCPNAALTRRHAPSRAVTRRAATGPCRPERRSRRARTVPDARRAAPP